MLLIPDTREEEKETGGSRVSGQPRPIVRLGLKKKKRGGGVNNLNEIAGLF